MELECRHLIDSPANRILVARETGLSFQESFEDVLAEMGSTRLEKATEYGEDRHEGWDVDEEDWMIFSDIYRKFIRLRQQVHNHDHAGMRSTCLDLANYGAMGVQLIDNRTRSNDQ